MTEHRMPIPARAYNAAVGGHVCGPEDIDFGQKVVHLIKYDKDGNEVSFESQVTQTNKIYVIHDDFTLSSNVTIPANCVLEFEGGSISGAHTITGNNTGIKAGLVKIFTTDITTDGSWNIGTVYPEWFGARQTINNLDQQAIRKAFVLGAGNTIEFSSGKTYILGSEIPETQDSEAVLAGYIEVFSNTEIIINGTLECIGYAGFELFSRVLETPAYSGVHDVYIHGHGTFVSNGPRNVVFNRVSPFRVHHCSNIRMEDITIKDFGMHHAIETGATRFFTIKNVKFIGGIKHENYGAEAFIQIEESGGGASGAMPYDNIPSCDITIDGCAFKPSENTTYTKRILGTLHGDLQEGLYYKNIIIKNCIFENLVSDSSANSPQNSVIYLDTCHKNAIIENNSFINCGGTAIAGFSKSEGVIIRNNKIINQGVIGIWIVGSNIDSIFIEDNYIDNNGDKYTPSVRSATSLKPTLFFQAPVSYASIINNIVRVREWKSSIVASIPSNYQNQSSILFRDNVVIGVDNMEEFVDTYYNHINRFDYKKSAKTLNNQNFVSYYELDITPS